MTLIQMEEELIRRTEQLRLAMEGADTLDDLLRDARSKIRSLEARLRHAETLAVQGSGFCSACRKPVSGYLA